MQCACAILSLWPVQLYSIFSHYLIKERFSEKKITRQKNVFLILCKIFSERVSFQGELSEILPQFFSPTALPCILILSRLHLSNWMHNQIVLEVLKLTIKFTLKCPYMFLFNKPSSGTLLSCFVEVIIIKIVKTVVVNPFGLVAANLSSPYWCVYSAQWNSINLHCALYTHM